jgi:hypothetical protein
MRIDPNIDHQGNLEEDIQHIYNLCHQILDLEGRQ